jgi:hypothetical protein
LEQLALERSALAGLKDTEPRKIAIARVIRARTAVANEWITPELALGLVTSVSRYCSDKFRLRDLPRFTLWRLRSHHCYIAACGHFGREVAFTD